MFKLFCKHKWNKINDLVVPSEADMIKDMGKYLYSFHRLTRVYVTDYSCELCGRIKRFKTETAS